MNYDRFRDSSEARHIQGIAEEHSSALCLARDFTSALTVAVVWAIVGSASVSSEHQDRPPARIPPWPCRLVVKPTLLGVVEEAWERSPTFRHQCRELADASSVVVLEWRESRDSQSRAISQMGRDATGVIVAMVYVPPVKLAVELVAHEIEHVLEMIRGEDLAAQSRRHDSGVWQAFDGFESRRAIDIGRQVAREVEDSRRAR